MAKICEVGQAKISLFEFFVNSKAIDNNGKVLFRPTLERAHEKIQEYLFQRFGINRQIIDDQFSGIVIQWNTDALGEIDALYGFNYKENKKYWRDYTNDSTLTPEQLVSKYVKVNSSKVGLAVKKAADFTKEEADKIVVGMKSIYPDVVATLKPMYNVGGEQRYTVDLSLAPINEPLLVPDDSPASLDKQYDSKDQAVVEHVMQPLLSKMQNVTQEWVSRKELENKLLYTYGAKSVITKGGRPIAVAVGRKVYLVEGEVTGKVALEELMHIFVDGLITNRPALYKGLLNQALQDYPGIATQVEIEYSNENRFNQEYRDAELVTRALRDAYIQERIQRPDGLSKNDFMKLAERFWNWLMETLNKIFNVESLPLDTTIEQLAVFLNIKELQLPDSVTLGPRYNLGDSAENLNDEFDDDIDLEQKATKSKKTTKELKLEKLKAQRSLLRVASAAAGKNKAILATIEKLKRITVDYEKIVKADTDTISTSKFIGQPDLLDKLKEELNPAQDYGRFIHGYMEKLMEASLRDKENIIIEHTRIPELFDQFYEDNQAQLSLPGLTKSIVKEDIELIIGTVSEYYSLGDIVIPELTIYGTDNRNTVVVSRLDFLVIKPDGSTVIGDFKTTKLNMPIIRYDDRSLYKQYRNKKLLKGVHPAFKSAIARNKVSTYIAQLGVYDRSLQQHNIKSNDNVIINALYTPEEVSEDADVKEWVYKDLFVRKVPITGEKSIQFDRDENGNLTAISNPIYERVIKALSVSIPVEGEDTLEQTIQAEENKIKQSVGKLSEQSAEILLRNIKSLIEKQLDAINIEFKTAEEKKADFQKINELKQRRNLLQDAKSYYEKASTIDNATVVAAVIEKVFELIDSTKKEAERIAETETSTKAKIEKLSIKNVQFTDLLNFLVAFRSIVKTSGVTEAERVMDIIDENIRQIELGQKPYLNEAKKKFVEVLLSVPKRNADMMLDSMRQLLEGRKAKLERIVNGDISVLSAGGFWLGRKFKGLINSVKGSQTTKTISQDMKESAQEELNQINYFFEHPEYTKEFVELYVENTFTNPESGFYIGSTVSTGYGSMSIDDFRSSFGNSELALTAMANYGISMTDAAQQQFWDQMEKLQIDQKVKTLSSQYGGYEGLNRAISEVVKVKDFATGEEDSYMAYTGPIMRAYFDKYNELDYAIQEVSSQIASVKQDTSLSDDQRKKRIKELGALKKQKNLELQEWLLKNSNTKLKPDVYNLHVQLPEDIQDEINEIQESIAKLKSESAVGDWFLSDSILSEIQEKELKISQLRQEAIKDNPNFKEIFEKFDEYFGNTINQGLYDYIERKMISQYGKDSLEIKRWYEINSEEVPNQEWYDKRADIMEKLRELQDEDLELNDLYERRRKIMNKYTFKSQYAKRNVFDPTFMSDEDAEELDDIEQDIENYYEQLKEENKDKRVDFSVRNLRNLLNKMQEEVSKPKYVKDFESRLSNLERILQDLQVATNSKEKERLAKDYLAEEERFKKWYDRNNTETYELGSLKDGDIPAQIPKRYNVMKVPTDKKMMTRVPTSKYRMRFYKEEAYNPLYSPTLEKRVYGKGSYAMPIGITYNNETKRFDVNPKSPWVNPKYLEIIKDKTLKSFYDDMVMDQYYNKQVGMSANKLGFFFPSVRQSGFDTLSSDGMKGLRREWNETVDSLLYRRSESEQADNEYGIAGQNRVKFAYNYSPAGKPALPESLVTKDGINAIIKWRFGYEVNQKMEEANLAMSPMVDYLKARLSEIPSDQPLVKQQVEKVISIFEFERDKFIYGKQFDAKKKQNEFLNRKTLRMFLTAASWARLAFDPGMQVGNLLAGNVQAFLAVNMKDYGRGTTEDYLWAKNQMYGTGLFLYKIISNWGEVSGVNLETKIMRYFNPLTKIQDDVLDVTSRGKMRRLLNKNVKDIAFLLQDKGEIEIALTTLLKNLHAYKFKLYETDASGNVKIDAQGNKILKKDENGEFVEISAYDALEDVRNSALPNIRKDVAMDYSDLEGIKSQVQNEYIRHQGNYSPLTQAPAEAGFIGVLMFFFRKYLVGALEVRFKGAFGIGNPKNWISSEAQVGWWTAVSQVIGNYGVRSTLKSMLPGFAVDKLGGSDVPLVLRNKVFQARNETLIAITLYVMSVQLRAMVFPGDDDDEVELTWSQMQAMRALAKVSNESRSMVPIPIAGKLEDYIKNFATFTTALNEFQNYAKMLNNGLYYILYEVFESDYFYDQSYYQRRAGRYEAGDAKIVKDIYKVTSIENIQDAIDPSYSLKELYKKKN